MSLLVLIQLQSNLTITLSTRSYHEVNTHNKQHQTYPPVLEVPVPNHNNHLLDIVNITPPSPARYDRNFSDRHRVNDTTQTHPPRQPPSNHQPLPPTHNTRTQPQAPAPQTPTPSLHTGRQSIPTSGYPSRVGAQDKKGHPPTTIPVDISNAPFSQGGIIYRLISQQRKGLPGKGWGMAISIGSYNISCYMLSWFTGRRRKEKGVGLQVGRRL